MNPRRYSQIERALQILDKSGTTDILRDDHSLLFLFKKTERIVAALYVITGLFPDSEPLKWALRESGSLLIEHVLSFKERSTVHSKEFLSDTLAEVAHIFSLVDIAYIADLLSSMNFSVLKKELEMLLTIIEGRGRASSLPLSPPFLEESFFGIPKDIFGESKLKETQSETFSKGFFPVGERGEVTLQSLSEFERLKRTQKDTYLIKGHEDIKDSPVARRVDEPMPKSHTSVPRKANSSSSERTREDRKQGILAVLRQKDKAMIKDFSEVITECSEKTIQRLLVELVQTGVLKREGDRRWSRYSLHTSA